MRLEISIPEMLFDIADRSHNELAVITDAEARYTLEAGTDKRDEIFRHLTDAISRLDVELQRFTVDPPEIRAVGTNDMELTDDASVTFILQDTSRRRRTQIESVAQLVHSYLVCLTLSLFYETKVSTVQNQYGNNVAGVAERVATVCSQEATNSLSMIEKYMYTKLRPVRSVRGTKDNGVTI